MQVPFRMRPVGRALVEPHGVRKRSFEQAIIGGGEAVKDGGQILALNVAELVEAGQMMARQDHGFERPDRPERYYDGEVPVFDYHALAALNLKLEVIAEETRIFVVEE